MPILIARRPKPPRHFERIKIMDIETVNSAIRHATTEALCLIHTNFGRWLIVEGYPQERTEALSRNDTSPIVGNLRVIGDSSEREFHWHCSN